MSEIRVMLVDDHDVVRTGLKTYLEAQEGVRVVAEADSGTKAVKTAVEIQPDVVVMDITMADMDGLEATRRIVESCSQCKILALTVHEDKQYLFEMLAAGAVGYLTKQAAAEELVAAIRSVAGGDVYLQPVLARWLLEDYQRLQAKLQEQDVQGLESEDESLDVLSRREQQVLELLADSLTNVQMGEVLGISPKTVARHRERIMKKLGLHSSTELVKFAIRTGLVSLDGS